MANKIFQGSGGGGKKSSNDPDNLKSEDIVEFVLAVSEGPIRGLSKGAKSFNVGETPLVSEDGTANFEKFAIGVHPGFGEDAASALNLRLGGITSSTQVGVSLLKDTPVTRTSTGVLRNTIDTLEVRLLVSRLVLITDSGSKNNTASFRIEYKASSSPTWLPFVGNSADVSVYGKTTSGVLKEYTRDVPRLLNDDWSIRVTKLSQDGDEKNIVELQWESFQCVNKDKKKFPDTALVHGIGTANGQFSSIPEFSGVYDGLLVRIPTNYNPDTHTYDDSLPWDGSFKFGWTENPAWILFDLITNTRYGLAKHRRYIDANRFAFYEAARWCDIPVKIGDTNAERPRYTFNDVIIEPRQAMEMLNYVAGSFNALIWDDLQGQIHLRVDKDDPAVQMFTPENITDEGFSYTFTDSSVRCNDVSVAFINPDLDWAEDRRRISGVTTSEENIEKFGRIPLDFIAVGCTNVSEAVAKAQVRLISALTETTMVSFVTTRQGALLSLYDVILVADPVMGWTIGGRISSLDSGKIYFRDAIFIETMKDYVMKIQMPDGIFQTVVRPSQTGHVNELNLVGDALPDTTPGMAIFTLEEEGGLGFGKPFRVIALEEVDGSPYMYRVSAIEINRNKYLLSETGTPITEPDYSYNQPYLPGRPTNFVAVSGDEQLLVMPTGEVVSRILCSWRKPFAAVVKGYQLEFKLVDDEAWQTIKLDSTEQYISPVKPGSHYSLRVAAIDPQDHLSSWATISDYEVEGKSVKPDGIATFTATGDIFQILLQWTYGGAPDIAGVEIWANTTNQLSSSFQLSTISFPSTKFVHTGLSAIATFFYWIRVKDTSGNYSDFSTSRTASVVSNPGKILDILTGWLSESQLNLDLQTRIDLIDGPATTPGTTAWQVLQEANARVADLVKEAAERNAAILAEAQARGAAITEVNRTIQTVSQSVSEQSTTLTAAIGRNLAAIQDINNVSAGSNSAAARSIASLVTQSGAQQASINSINDVSSSSDSAIARQVNTLNVNYGTTQAQINQINFVSATSSSAIAQSVASLNTQLGTANANISAINTVSSSSSSAIARSVASLSSSLGTIQSSITEINTVTSSSGSAIARATFNMQSRLNNVSGVTMEQAFSTQASVNSGLYAQYTVKIDINGYVAGFGFAATANNAAPSSEFIIRADKFAFGYPGVGSKYPFVIGTVNGVSTVGISGALVVDGSLSVKEANIGTAVISTLKIANEAATATRTITGNGGFNVLGSIVINIPEATNTSFTAIATVQITGNAGAETDTHTLILRANGSQISSYTGRHDGNIPICGAAYLGPGSNTFSLISNTQNTGGSAQAWTLTVFAMKR